MNSIHPHTVNLLVASGWARITRIHNYLHQISSTRLKLRARWVAPIIYWEIFPSLDLPHDSPAPSSTPSSTKLEPSLKIEKFPRGIDFQFRRLEDVISMTAKEGELVVILSIGRATSPEGGNLSLDQALTNANYPKIRKTFEAKDLIALLRSHPEFIDHWILYSENKRTSGGWYVLRDPMEVGRLIPQRDATRFSSIEEAVANFIIRELDFWAHI